MLLKHSSTHLSIEIKFQSCLSHSLAYNFQIDRQKANTKKREHSIEPLDIVFLFEFEWQLKVFYQVRSNTHNNIQIAIQSQLDSITMLILWTNSFRVLEIDSIRLYGFMSFAGENPLWTCAASLVYTLNRWSSIVYMEMMMRTGEKRRDFGFRSGREGKWDIIGGVFFIVIFGGNLSVEWNVYTTRNRIFKLDNGLTFHVFGSV